MALSTFFFCFLASLAVVAAIGVVASKNPVFSVLWLIIVFFAISGLYILMNAQFLAIVNLIVYAGAIMVLFLFVIMQNLNSTTEPFKHMYLRMAGLISGLCLMIVFIAALSKPEVAHLNILSGTDIGLISNLGMKLFNDYVVPFELSSVLFLSALVGAVVIGKKDEDLVNY